MKRKSRNIISTIVLSLCAGITQAQVSSTQGFEDEDYKRVLTFKGSIQDNYGIWIDGGTGASLKYRDHVNSDTIFLDVSNAKNLVGFGDNAMVLAGKNTADKPMYSSVYTKTLDLDSANNVNISFSYLQHNKKGTYWRFPLNQMLYIEVSNDDWKTYTELKAYDVSDSKNYLATPYQIMCGPPAKNSEDAASVFGGDAVGEVVYKSVYSSCAYPMQNTIHEHYHFASAEVGINARNANLLTSNTSFRVRANFSNVNLNVYIDDLTLTVDDGNLNNTAPVSTYTTLPNRKLYNTESFEVTENATWGIWADGGADVYQSGSYPSPTTSQLNEINDYVSDHEGATKEFVEGLYDKYTDGKHSVAIREFYDPDTLEDPDNEFSGEKPDYSSIVTKNLDLTDHKELELRFSFVSLGLGYRMDNYLPEMGASGDGDKFSVYITRDSGINWTLVKSYVAGVDFLNNVRYSDVNLKISNEDFKDLTGTPYDYDGFTTTTKIRIQSQTGSTKKIIYLDNVSIFTAGNSGIDFGAETYPNWSSLDFAKLNSDGENTYDKVNSVFHTGIPELETRLDLPGQYGAVEHSDCSHPAGLGLTKGITEVYDNILSKNVLSFNINKTYDTDRCKNTDEDAVFDQEIGEGETEYHPYKNEGIMGGSGEIPDRQRIEIKTLKNSEESQKAELGETHFYAWKFKLPANFKASNMFTHLHQIKSKGADKDEEGKPLITLTAGGEKVDLSGNVTEVAQMRLRYSPEAQSQINLATADLSLFTGNWVQAVEKITVGEAGLEGGNYELRIYKINVDGSLGDEIMGFKSDTLRMNKTNAEFMRVKWGIYRSLIEQEKLQNQSVRFADIIVLEANDKNASLADFTNSLDDLSDTNNPFGTTTTNTGTGNSKNLASSGKATQSSTAHGGLASRAIDGDTNGHWGGNSVTHTSNQSNAWWEVELDQVSDINKIVIYNRTNCCTDRLSNFTVEVLDKNDTTVWSKFYRNKPSPSLPITLSATGKKVRVSLKGTLSLAEVEVFGTPAGSVSSNLAQSGTAKQSSTIAGGLASRAIDGDTNGHWGGNSVTHTSNQSNAWWEVELDQVSDINQIVIYNRTNCCTDRLSNFTVEVLDKNGTTVWSKFYSNKPSPSLPITLNATGKKVRVSLKGILSLAEVEVFGTPAGSVSSNFTPDPSKSYFIDSEYGRRLMSNGSSESAWTTATSSNNTSSNAKWKFVAKGNGYWHLQRAAGGKKPRIRTDNSANADMQATSSSGVYTYYAVEENPQKPGKYLLTLPDGPTKYKRLQFHRNGTVRMVTTSSAGTWESFVFTEAN